MTQITLQSSTRDANRLRVTLTLSAGHSLEGLNLSGARLTVYFQNEAAPDIVLSETLTLEAPICSEDSACFVKHENGLQQVILTGPLENSLPAQQSA